MYDVTDGGIHSRTGSEISNLEDVTWRKLSPAAIKAPRSHPILIPGARRLGLVLRCAFDP